MSSSALRGTPGEPIPDEVARFYRGVIEQRLAEGHGGPLTDELLARLSVGP